MRKDPNLDTNRRGALNAPKISAVGRLGFDFREIRRGTIFCAQITPKLKLF